VAGLEKRLKTNTQALALKKPTSFTKALTQKVSFSELSITNPDKINPAFILLVFKSKSRICSYQ